MILGPCGPYSILFTSTALFKVLANVPQGGGRVPILIVFLRKPVIFGKLGDIRSQGGGGNPKIFPL